MTPTPTTMLPSASWRIGRRVLHEIGRTLAALFGLIVVLRLVGAILRIGGGSRRCASVSPTWSIGGRGRLSFAH
jgi:hypothetical protein